MPFAIKSDQLDQFYVQVVDEPQFIHGLRMGRENRENILETDNWLVLAFAVWSITDQPCIQLAIDFTKSLNGNLSLALRPFESIEEFAVWADIETQDSLLTEVHSAITADDKFQVRITGKTGQTPIWLCLRDGVVKGERRGPLEIDELRTFTSTCFANS